MKKRTVNAKERKGGVALIISVGILALLAMIATSFAINMQLEYKAAVNQINYTKATALAAAGMEKVMADIREKAKTSAYSEVIATFPDDYTTNEVALGDGTYDVTIEREDDKVNINALDVADYPWIKKLIDNGLSYNDIAKIIDYRDADSNVTTEMLNSAGAAVQVATGSETNAKNAPYATVEELRLVLNDNTKYDGIKNVVTVSAPIIRGGLTGKYYLNRTSGWDQNAILDLTYYRGKVIELGMIKETKMPGAYDDESADGAWAGAPLANYDFSMNNFGIIFEGFIYIPQSKVNSTITYYMRHDDGVRLYVDGQRIINTWTDKQMDPESSGASSAVTYAGWHPIKIEYYENGGYNAIELRWNGLGAKEYVPAEYLGYYPPPYSGPAKPTTTSTKATYGSAGFYKMTSTGKVKTSAGAVLAQKKISAQIRVFGAWTQSTRAEFSAAFYSAINDFTDGEILNMTWFDSCPLDATASGPSKQLNALKLGYWDDFDEDSGYSVVNLSGNSHWSQFVEYTVEDRKLEQIASSGGQILTELNGYYYYVDGRTGYDLFVSAEEIDGTSPKNASRTAYNVGWLYVKYPSSFQSSSDFKGDPNTRGYYTLLKQDWTPAYGGDTAWSELNLNTGFDGGYNSQVSYSYSEKKTLGAVGTGAHYAAYIANSPTGAAADREASNAATIALDAYDATVDAGTQAVSLTVYWDNIRMIPSKGFFISTPFCEIPGAEDGEVDWGYISWTEVSQANQTATLQGREANTLAGFTSDPGTWGNWAASYNSPGGQALNLSKAKFFQYKVMMEDTGHDGKTPAVTDITVTYLPRTEVLYSRTEVE